MNGTIGILNLKEKKFLNLIRTHNEEINFIEYNKNVKKLITTSSDYTIRIWSVDKEVIDQLYEFRCLEEEITSLATFKSKPWFICGSKRGILRVFDLIK
jgi:WD40 repeat protein